MPFRCHSCGRTIVDVRATCDSCGGFVRYVKTESDRLSTAVESDPRAALPEFRTTVSMGEGETPVVPLDDVDEGLTVHAKLESLNPTCSFKDRGSSLVVSAVADPDTSWEALVVASTGNTAPSVAAYAARAGVPCAVLVPEDTSLSKLSQVTAHHAEVYSVEGTFSDCFQFAQRASGERVLNATAVYSANPFVVSANRTVAFEIISQLGEPPDWVSVPVGAGPLLGGTHLGFTELYEADIISSVPKMLCVQAEGCHPITRAVERNEPVRPWTEPITTEVGAIADPLDGYAEDGEETRRAVVESDGDAVALDDNKIFTWTDRLAATEGVYAEPASAASVAAVETSVFDVDETIVALVTGHGLKESHGEDPNPTPIGDDPDRLRATILD